MKAVLTAAVLCLFAAAPLGAADICGIPPSEVEVFSHLPRIHAAVKNDKKLDVLVLSAAASQTGPASGLKTYPATLESDLRTRLKDVAVSVFAIAVPKKTIDAFDAALPRLLTERKPNLVIWQTGTIEAIRGIDPDIYGDKLQFAITGIMKAGADVILVNPQYSPQTSFLFNAGPYIDNIRWVAQTKDVPVFNRYAIMKYWEDNEIFNLSAVRSNGSYEKLHHCLGELLADFVIRAGSLAAGRER